MNLAIMPTDNQARTARITIQSSLENVALAGLAVKGICGLLPFDEKTAYQIELCVVEAVTNVIKHAYHRQTGHEVVLLVVLGADHLSISITDQGRPGLDINPPRSDFDPNDRTTAPEGGFGLIIINSVMDEIHYSSDKDGNVLRMVKKIPYRCDGPACVHHGLAE